MKDTFVKRSLVAYLSNLKFILSADQILLFLIIVKMAAHYENMKLGLHIPLFSNCLECGDMTLC